jgi:splicing factor 3B subunit 5
VQVSEAAAQQALCLFALVSCFVEWSKYLPESLTRLAFTSRRIASHRIQKLTSNRPPRATSSPKSNLKMVNPPAPPFIYNNHQLTPLQADKLRTQQQLEALQNKYIGTGHADTTKHEWTSNIMRDSYASFQGHPSMLLYMSVGMGSNVEAVRRHCMENMVLPVGPPPATEDE